MEKIKNYRITEPIKSNKILTDWEACCKNNKDLFLITIDNNLVIFKEKYSNKYIIEYLETMRDIIKNNYVLNEYYLNLINELNNRIQVYGGDTTCYPIKHDNWGMEYQNSFDYFDTITSYIQIIDNLQLAEIKYRKDVISLAEIKYRKDVISLNEKYKINLYDKNKTIVKLNEKSINTIISRIGNKEKLTLNDYEIKQRADILLTYLNRLKQ